MQRWRGWLVASLVAVGSVAFAVAEDQEGKVSLDKVPKAVLDAVKTKYAKGKIVAAEFETESGTKLYKLDVKVGNAELEVKVRPDGKILRVEKEIAPDKLPPTVRKAFAAKFPGKHIKKVEQIEQRGLVLYEIEFYLQGTSGKDKEVMFTAEGKEATVEEGGEIEVPVAELPKKVVSAVKALFPHGELTKGEKEKLDEEIVYTVVVKDKGKPVEVTLNGEGKILEVEKEVAAKDLPKAVVEALRAKYPKAAIEEAAVEIKGESKVYRVSLLTADKKKVDVKLDAGGKILIEERKDKKND